MKVRQIITLKGWINGSGWSYEQDYDDQVIEVDENELEVMEWDWWETDEENLPSEESDTQIIVKFYAEDADVDDDEPLATHKAWVSEIWEDRHSE